MKEGKKPKFKLGVADAKLGAAIQDETSIPCVCNEFTGEVGRRAAIGTMQPYMGSRLVGVEAEPTRVMRPESASRGLPGRCATAANRMLHCFRHR